MNDSASKPRSALLLQPDNHNKKYEVLFVEIDTGQIELPLFQREFVLGEGTVGQAYDSIRANRPITLKRWAQRRAKHDDE